MMKKTLTILLLCAALTMSSLGGCAPETGGTAGSNYSQTNTQQTESAVMHQAELEQVDSYSEAGGVRIALDGTNASADGSGCQISGSTVTITSAGTYTVSGRLEGQIIVDAKGEKVHLVLDGADITCQNSSPIYIRKAKKVTVTLAEGSVNTLTDGTDYDYDDAAEEEPNAALFSKADLILEGSGALIVNANFNNGIQSKDTLEIHSGTYTVNAVNHGITGRDSLAIGGGSFDIAAGGDGIRSNNADSGDVGWISILGGSYDINAGQDGIQAESTLHIGGGEYTITTGGGSENVSSDSAKAVKAGSDVLLENGSFVIDSCDDALHSDGSLSVTGGDLTISTGGDGIHADSELNISGGSLIITKSFEGIEGVRVNISGGYIDVTSSDDAINSAGGDDGDSHMFAVDENCDITISGGVVIADASGDGIDSNGNIHVSGGTLVVNGPTNSGNGSLDYNGECVVSGGLVAVSGSSGMAQGGSASSTQANMLLCFTTGIRGGTLVSLTDENGSVVYAFAPTKDFSSVFVSFPGMEVGKTYKLWIGGSCSGQPQNGIYTDGSLSDG
ncbi:MAG: carbohydrate-binding domain-containing protein, partial [Ruminococcaceae bacterium]|nr:carbohydrate-binding domain-containing protein [Oscillospiraceae bacterium]